jgi:UDP-N-acetylglucosamine 1-carboxyvinyltransferase
MGASIKVEGSSAIVNGVERYSGADISAPDLRAGAALVIAGLTADGFTTIDNIHFIERGYEDFDIKLRELGAQIEKVDTDEEVRKFELKMA